jgi:hypothetical protein
MAGTNKILAGPVAMSATMTTNIYNPASGIYGEIKQIHVCNKTAGPITYSLWLGATGGNVAGTEIANAKTVAANSIDQIFFSKGMKLSSTQFLVGGASAGTSLTITLLGEESVI